jgi:hypothetical protein
MADSVLLFFVAFGYARILEFLSFLEIINHRQPKETGTEFISRL